MGAMPPEVSVKVSSQLPVMPEEPGVGFELDDLGRVQPTSATTAVNIASDLSLMRRPPQSRLLLASIIRLRRLNGAYF